MATSGKLSIKVSVDNVEALRLLLLQLTEKEVLVGFPEDTTDRKPDPENPNSEITNAAIAYIQDTGAPDQNIPARPFMYPGIRDATPGVIRHLVWTARQVLNRTGAHAVDQGFERVGLTVQAALRRKINEGIPPPLSEWTLRDRARRGRKGAMWELAWRAAGAPPSTELAKPLVDTGQLRNAVNYVVRKRKRRK